jgi:PAS domain-containing protein
MIAGTDAAEIARTFGVPHRSALHHKRYHLPRLLQKIRAVDEQLEVAALRKMLVDIGVEMRGLYEQFKKSKDFRGALVALDKLLCWWTTAATMIGIAEPPEGHQEKPIDMAQAARDLFGLTEDDMPTLGEDAQRALPAPEDATEKAPETPPSAPQAAPEPAESMAARYRRTQGEIQVKTPDGNWQIQHDPNIEERIKRATPVKNLYQEQLDRIHAQGRRAEVGELSPKPGNTT